MLIDFLALCANGKALGPGAIRANRFSYKVDNTDNLISITFDEAEAQAKEKDDLVELVGMYIGARMLGAKALLQSDSKLFVPDAEFFKTHLPEKKQLLDFRKAICEQTCLTLNDMIEVSELLRNERRPASILIDDRKFRESFPGMESKWGGFGFIRHRSGTEIRPGWRDNEYLDFYGYECPNPIKSLLVEWMRSKGLKFEEAFGYKYRRAKWKLSKMLNKVPEADKQRVYQWVIDIIFDLDNFHDTRGGTPLPERLECEFANCILVVDHTYNFELIEC